MDFIIEFVFGIIEILFDAKDLINEKHLKKLPLKKVLFFLLVVFCFIERRSLGALHVYETKD